MLTVLTIVGARPQFIKAAVISRALRDVPDMREVLLHTGQHYDPNMSDVFFTELDIPKPDVYLGVGSASHGKQTAAMIEGIEAAILTHHPDWVLIYGDTNSTLAGAIAAAKLHVPVAHVEAGLRSFNRCMPEEINRIVADRLATLLFCPTETAVRHLAAEGITQGVFVTGDVMYDAALFYGEKSQRTSQVLTRIGVEPGRYALTTVHRAENTDDRSRLAGILAGLARVAQTLPVVLPLHPRTRNILQASRIDIPANLIVLEPVSFLDMLALEQGAALILTDSGGVQKEAYFYHVPCVILRDETEWTELVEAGWNRLAGTDPAVITAAAEAALQSKPHTHPPFYGTGDAGRRILNLLRAEPTPTF